MITSEFLGRVKAGANGYKSYHNRDDNDMPIALDSIQRDAWVRDGSDRHERSQQRRNYLDNRALVESMRYHESHMPTLVYTRPTSAQIDKLDKYSNQFFGEKCHGRVRHTAREGKLPAVLKQIYEGTLLNKSTGDIEHEIRDAERFGGNRLFDKSGYNR